MSCFPTVSQVAHGQKVLLMGMAMVVRFLLCVSAPPRLGSPTMRLTSLPASSLLSALSLLLGSGCLQFADEMTFLEAQQEPIAVGL